MDYNLDSLGSRNFEHLTQALLGKLIGPKLMVFGDGPDGGREATWRGDAPSMDSQDRWNGYGVLQAKFKLISESPAQNLTWLKASIRAELSEWVRNNTRRKEKPDFILFVTNVRLSSVPDNGKDEIHDFIGDLLIDLKLPLKGYRVWDYYELIAHLDQAASVRRRYAAFITSGDLIAALLKEVEDLDESFGQAILAYTARSLKDDNRLNLTQAGTAGDGQVTIGEVFIDLPAVLPRQPWLSSENLDSDVDKPFDTYEDFEDTEDVLETRSGIVEHLVNDFNHIPEMRRDEPHRTVLVGGPGQGKSTATQWIAQMYRAEFLKCTTAARSSEIASIRGRIEARSRELELPSIQARRWPVRIILSELADYLADAPRQSLMHYLSHKISDRSSFAVEPSMLRKWLTNYPWLLLIDGLDEVPASSNRDQVMSSIEDFFIDVAAVGGDVAAVATTRPQGYSDEFSAEEYRHFPLDGLRVEEALSYADKLVGLRMGEGTPAATKVLNRLTRASKEEHTRKLFETPLQVTILEVLLEKLGKAPSDRSRLYSSYYQVISQREQEKSGALSDLLQKYESDVLYLHRRIGFELQDRGSVAGESTPSLTLSEFDEFISARFQDQGHTSAEVAVLSKDFSDLVTDRLVLLAKLQADRVGFELRSLQEHMAGEYIVNRPEPEVIPELQRISVSAYWRNTVLFAVGSIFSSREHLRAEVVLLCDRLNDEFEPTEILHPGSELALDILRDGSCLSMPKYAKGLAKIAVKVMDSPNVGQVGMLLALLETDYSEVVWTASESSTSTSSTQTAQWINRAFLLSAMRADYPARADRGIRGLLDRADLALKKQIVKLAWDTRDWNLAEFIGQDFMLCPPAVFSRNALGHRRFARFRKITPTGGWMEKLVALNDTSHYQATVDKETSGSSSALWANFRHLDADHDVWEWVRGLDTAELGWAALKSIASFALEPSENSLAEALEAISSADGFVVPPIAPWPVAACVGYAKHGSQAERGRSFEDKLAALAQIARAGELGDAKTWRSAERRWSPSLAITPEVIEGSASSPGVLPLWPSLKDYGIAPYGFVYTIKFLDGDVYFDSAIKLIRSMTHHGRSEPRWAALALFLMDYVESFVDDVDLGDLPELMCSMLLEADVSRLDISWVDRIPLDVKAPTPPVLNKVAILPGIFGTVSEETERELVARANRNDMDIRLLRLALASAPGLLDEVSDEKFSLLCNDVDSDLLGNLYLAREVLKTDEETILAGGCDTEFETIASSVDGPFGYLWFTRLLEDLESNLTRVIAARGAMVVANQYPAIAEHWLDVASKHHRAMPAAQSAAPV